MAALSATPSDEWWNDVIRSDLRALADLETITAQLQREVSLFTATGSMKKLQEQEYRWRDLGELLNQAVLQLGSVVRRDDARRDDAARAGVVGGDGGLLDSRIQGVNRTVQVMIGQLKNAMERLNQEAESRRLVAGRPHKNYSGGPTQVDIHV